MSAEMASWTGSVPRRARRLIPAGLPHRAEVVAGCALAILVAHLLLAQLTLVLAVAFAVAGRLTRWRLWWLLAPAAIGIGWTLGVGPDRALAGFTDGPMGIFSHLTGPGGHPFAGFGRVQRWLPRQFPVALVTGAAEAALAGWLDWLHTDEWAVPAPRPGLLAAARRALVTRWVRAGAVVTREGCALGVVPSTGAVAELRWGELAEGTLVTGAAGPDVTVAGLQVVHAALRRRMALIVFDLGDASIERAVAAACRATSVPLLAGGAHPADLGRMVRERRAGLVPAGSAELAAQACAGLGSLAAELRRIEVNGDALVWVPHAEQVPADALAALLHNGAGLSVLVGTTSPAAARELSRLAGSVLCYRIADLDLAAALAIRAGLRLLPAAVADARSGRRPASEPSRAGLVAGPAIPARTLLALGPGEFVLAASAPRARLIATGQLVPARLPAWRPAERPAGLVARLPAGLPSPRGSRP